MFDTTLATPMMHPSPHRQDPPHLDGGRPLGAPEVPKVSQEVLWWRTQALEAWENWNGLLEGRDRRVYQHLWGDGTNIDLFLGKVF